MSLEMSPFDRVHRTFYWRSIVTMALSRVISEIFIVEKCRVLEIGVKSHSRSSEPTHRSATYDFLLTFHGNHGPISHRFRDRRRFQSKIAEYSHPRVFCTSAERVPLGIGYRPRGSKTSVMGLPGGERSLNNTGFIHGTYVNTRRNLKAVR